MCERNLSLSLSLKSCLLSLSSNLVRDRERERMRDPNKLVVLRSYVFLLRHGTTEHNASGIVQGSTINPPLNESGREQARAVGRALKDIHFDVVGSSGMRRARETADLIVASQKEHAAAAGAPARREKPHTVIPTLCEMHHGKFEGESLASNLKEIKALGQAWARGETGAACPGPGGESPVDVLNRALTGLIQVVEERRPVNMLLVAHSRVNKVLLAHLLEDSELHMMHKVPQENCCINLLCYDHKTKRFHVEFSNALFDANDSAAGRL